MTADRHIEELDAIEEARRQLQGRIPIPWHDVDRLAYEVIETNLSLGGYALVEKILTTCIEYYTTGMGC
jgi:hypothetical protein